MFWICAEKQVDNMEMFCFSVAAEWCLHSIKAFYASHITTAVRHIYHRDWHKLRQHSRSLKNEEREVAFVGKTM